ncbi:polysaccharide deacetylase family protein [Phyllobacterium leguminum]|uniref:Chitooligosaccharide deacetylase n=1 Tax=Phyllobacterium leguminum TaxID=314237 RepID=A0A318SYN9_9HYPH|nr:polysaccharide deacetylase family protein [Phyllobacterium leguminum]PYE86425.1 peptidoglycan/xylan/chitin deacetylase (PgdA/CDA1 family) [Phyllobacterium leguminum]
MRSLGSVILGGAPGTLALVKRRLKYAAIRVGLEAVASTGLGRLIPSAGGRGLIFTLHHVRPETERPEFAPNAIHSITPEFLVEAIRAVLERGLTPVHLHHLPALLANPADGRKFVAFTLDDGYRNNAEFAAPVFGKFNIPYTIFVNPGFVERTRTMWWETAAAMAREVSSVDFDFGNGPEIVKSATVSEKFGLYDRLVAFVQSTDEDEAVRRIDDMARSHRIDPIKFVDDLVMNEQELRDLAKDPLVHFGAHTVTHVNLRRVSAERLQREIRESTEAIERYVGCRPKSFSYPYGWSSAASDREFRAAADAGFATAVTTQPGVLSQRSLEQPTGLPRVSLNGNFQKKRYVEALISGLPFRLLR